MKFFTIILTLFTFHALYAFASLPANAQEAVEQKEWKNSKPFSEWLVDIREEAVSQGISKETLDSAFADVEPLEDIIELDRKQPEGKITLEEYIKRTVTSSRIKNGKNKLEENRTLLNEVAKKYSVPANVIVALWGVETSYGENTGYYNVINSLATLAYDGRRSDFFRKELLNALKIMDAEKLSIDSFEGSWAGAFGQCQFMPSSFLKFAVDFDKDGKRDIWFTEADIFASIANYLHSEGWNQDKDIDKDGDNFQVLLKWNRSSYFATAIGELATAIAK
jgi:membrane-bound lytic murein transglycosylase B